MTRPRSVVRLQRAAVREEAKALGWGKQAISPEDFLSMYRMQEGRCAICGVILGQGLHLDHDQGALRGLLCRPCNLGLGFFGDCPDRVQMASVYIARRAGVCDEEESMAREQLAQLRLVSMLLESA